MSTQKIIYTIAGLCLAGLMYGQKMSLNSSSESMAPTAATLTWETTNADLGIIKQNNPVQVDFRFTNTGNQPIVITDVTTSCGCTVAKHSQEPVKQGESSIISVTYNAKSVGSFHKTVTVKTSADTNPIILTLSGEVR